MQNSRAFNAARRAGRTAYLERKEQRPEDDGPAHPLDPHEELAEICGDIVDALDMIAAEMPRVQNRLDDIRSRINKLRWP
jgi:hypothetical protein